MYDVTLEINDRLPVYPGDPRPTLKQHQSLDHGDLLNASELTIGCHVGTHLDAPRHFLSGGADIASLAMTRLVGLCRVINIPLAATVNAEQLRRADLPKRRHLVFRTSRGYLLKQRFFSPDYVTFDVDTIESLLQAEPMSIGINAYSLDPADSKTFPVHRAMAEAGIPVAVCLDLEEVAAGDYIYSCLPLKLKGGDGAPARVLLFGLEEWRRIAAAEAA